MEVKGFCFVRVTASMDRTTDADTQAHNQSNVLSPMLYFVDFFLLPHC